MIIQQELSLQEKLAILTDAAKYDVACTSSGSDRRGQTGSMGNAASCGICHAFSADGRCVSLLKILMTNCCIYDCRYCVNRISNDSVRTTFTPEEICQLTMEFYRRNYIEGLFLSSGILNTPDETMMKIYETLVLLRRDHHFRGYIHVKAIPGADPELIRLTGLLADRMSINLELPTGDGLRRLAPAKTRQKILTPMRQIQNGIRSNQLQLQDRRGRRKALRADSEEFRLSAPSPSGSAGLPAASPEVLPDVPSTGVYVPPGSRFVPAGQSTQMIIGATPETDRQILSVTQALYDRFALKRVFFSAYTAVNEDSRLPDPDTPSPLLREHRLYQADWLLRFYGFRADELLDETEQDLPLTMDPKCSWAVHHPECFPVDVMTAPYAELLRVPGVGVRSARRIVTARRLAALDYPDLKKFGVVLKRAQYFLLCGGRSMIPLTEDTGKLSRLLSHADEKTTRSLLLPDPNYYQQNLFDDWGLA